MAVVKILTAQHVTQIIAVKMSIARSIRLYVIINLLVKLSCGFTCLGTVLEGRKEFISIQLKYHLMRKLLLKLCKLVLQYISKEQRHFEV